MTGWRWWTSGPAGAVPAASTFPIGSYVVACFLIHIRNLCVGRLINLSRLRANIRAHGRQEQR